MEFVDVRGLFCRFGTALRAGGAPPLYPAGLTLIHSFPQHCGGSAPNTPGPFGVESGLERAKPRPARSPGERSHHQVTLPSDG